MRVSTSPSSTGSMPASCCRRTFPTRTRRWSCVSWALARAWRAAARRRCGWSRAPTWRWRPSRPSCMAGSRHRTGPRPSRRELQGAGRVGAAVGLKLRCAVRIGLASHNLFDSPGRCDCPRARPDRLRDAGGNGSRAGSAGARSAGVLMYAPVVGDDDLSACLAYLTRRLDENTSPENFLRSLFTMDPDSQIVRPGRQFRARRRSAHRVHPPDRDQDRSVPSVYRGRRHSTTCPTPIVVQTVIGPDRRPPRRWGGSPALGIVMVDLSRSMRSLSRRRAADVAGDHVEPHASGFSEIAKVMEPTGRNAGDDGARGRQDRARR